MWIPLIKLILVVLWYRHLKDRKEKIKEKKRLSEENASFDLTKGICSMRTYALGLFHLVVLQGGYSVDKEHGDLLWELN